MSLSPSRWQQIATIYESALDRDVAGRDTFLTEACGEDEALRRDVESLLREEGTPDVLGRSVWVAAAALLSDASTLDVGTTLGPYRVEGRLGAGGMGDVYRAIDTRLNRHVAVKVLPTGIARHREMRARFAVEARAIAALRHPHICTLHDVGSQDDVDFLVMEHLEGETLAARLALGPLPVDQAVTYAVEIAGALDHAHQQGIVHRDLKPANIMLTADGTKLLDFGLARFLAVATPSGPEPDGSTAGAGARRPEDAAGVPADRDDRLTRHGTILGTIRYMAPEQLHGQEADARSDLFSFGAVLYEMLTGTRAFDGDTDAEVRTALQEHDPLPPSSFAPLVPRVLDDVVRGCLDKDPKERCQTAGEALIALKWASESSSSAVAQTPAQAHGARPRRAWTLAAGVLALALTAIAGWFVAVGVQRWRTVVPGEVRSIAVLPLESLSGGEVNESFADGMTEQLIADLASVGGLRVISRTSVMHYKAARKPVPVIARELRVDAIIEGTVAEAGGVVRITAKLISGATGAIIWSQRFERDVRDVLALQGDVARSITARVGRTVTGQAPAPVAGGRAIDPAVHRQVLLARHHAAKGTEEGLRKAVDFFNAAIARDPDNAPAHAGLAEAYTELSGFYLDPRQAIPKAKEAAETAIRLDGTLAEAHAALGYARLVYDWDGPAAESALLRALELNPSLATARLNYAAYLTTQARHDEAIREIRRAVDLDPLSVRTHTFGAMLLLFTRDSDQALDLTRRGLELEPDSGFTLAVQGVAYAEQGRYEAAVETMQRAAKLDDSLTILALQAHVLASAGRRTQAVEVLRRIEDAARSRYFCPYEIATVYVSLGDHDRAAELFRKGTHERADCMAWLGVEPWIDPFRADARYSILLRDVGLARKPR